MSILYIYILVNCNVYYILGYFSDLSHLLGDATGQAILVGKVGQLPVQKKLKNGTTVTLLSLGTGGIRNNRRPLDNEDPKEYANRCAIQWHRVSVYPPKLGELAMKNAVQG